MSGVRRIYVEKKRPYAVAASQLLEDIRDFLGVTGIDDVRILIRYDVENISDEVFEKACRTVFSEPPVDDLYLETIEIPAGARVFSVEPLPGQFDQRADSAVQCVQFLNETEKPIVRTAKTYILSLPGSRATASTLWTPARPVLKSPRLWKRFIPKLPT